MNSLPHSEPHERAVLGALLIWPEMYKELRLVLGPDDFYLERHRILWEAMSWCHEEHGEISLPSIKDAVERSGAFEKVGGFAFLAGLDLELPPPEDVPGYARLVREYAVSRRVISESVDLISYAMGRPRLGDLLSRYRQGYLDIEREGSVSGGAAEHFSGSDVDIEGDELEVIGLPTGLTDLDRCLLGYPPGHLGIVGGRPGNGKTSLGLNFAIHMAKRGAGVLFFSLEMPTKGLVRRMVAAESGVPLRSIQLRRWPEGGKEKALAAHRELSALPIWIDDQPALSVEDILSRSRRHQIDRGLGIVIVDYLQLLRSRQRFERRDLEVGHISSSLKIMAKELEIPVIALSQLNRMPEKRADRMPELADLKESGSLEQDADSVCFVHTPIKHTRDPKDFGKAHLILAKNRDGETGFITVAFDLATQKFSGWCGSQEAVY